MSLYYLLKLYLLLCELNLYACLYIYCTMTSFISSSSLGLAMDLMEQNKLN